MDPTVTRFLDDLIARLDGPLHFRLVVQPVIASIFAVRDGLRDERKAEPGYLLSLLTNSHLRRKLILDGWRSIARVFLLAVVLDAVYQVIVVRWFYPIETLFVAIGLALFPYGLVRGLTNRVEHALSRSRTTGQSSTVSSRDGRSSSKS